MQKPSLTLDTNKWKMIVLWSQVIFSCRFLLWLVRKRTDIGNTKEAAFTYCFQQILRMKNHHKNIKHAHHCPIISTAIKWLLSNPQKSQICTSERHLWSCLQAGKWTRLLDIFHTRSTLVSFPVLLSLDWLCYILFSRSPHPTHNVRTISFPYTPSKS